jgi:hypothetical protein
MRGLLDRLPPVLLALIAQLLAAAVAVPLADVGVLALPAWLVHGILAAAGGAVLGLPGWWLPINLSFVPGALLLSTVQLSSLWFLAAFVVMTAVFWTTYRSRVPLYLSGPRACDALARLLPPDRPFKFLDLGCGFGGVLNRLSEQFPGGRFCGVEIAPLPAAIARLRSRRTGRFQATQGNFWALDFARFDVIYAFLSPAPMQELWTKVMREARPGTLFVSNSFCVPGVEPAEQIRVRGDQRPLYVWRL